MSRTFRRWLFDAGATVYDWLTDQEVWRSHCRSLVEHFPDTDSPPRVLDLGIGPGVSGFGIIQGLPSARVTGLDFSAKMLRRAQRNANDENVSIPLVQADAARIPFRDATFDVVTGHSFLYLIPMRARVAKEVRRVLRPGGRCVFLEPAAHTDWRTWLRMSGNLRFRTSMVLWRLFSRRLGRFEPAALRDLLGAELDDVRVRSTLYGLGLVATATAPRHDPD
ncbi:class I SAM-dependent methyltransferase [Planctomycetota bacterium]